MTTRKKKATRKKAQAEGESVLADFLDDAEPEGQAGGKEPDAESSETSKSEEVESASPSADPPPETEEKEKPKAPRLMVNMEDFEREYFGDDY